MLKLKAVWVNIAFMVIPSLGFGQSSRFPEYTRSQTDTIHYREVTIGKIELMAPQGTIPMTTEHDARIAIRFGTSDSAWAWYQNLIIAATTPMGAKRPETSTVLTCGVKTKARIRKQNHIASIVTPKT